MVTSTFQMLAGIDAERKQSIQTIDSREIADMTGKRHSDVIRSIEQIVSRESHLAAEYTESEYQHFDYDRLSRKYKKFDITSNGYKRLMSQYEHRAKPASLEKAFSEWIETLFDESVIECQKQIGKYRVDFVIAGSVLIEYDEKEHRYSVAVDQERERQVFETVWRETVIENPWLSNSEPTDHVSFIRVRQGQEIEGIRKILLEVARVTGSDLAMFIKKGEFE